MSPLTECGVGGWLEEFQEHRSRMSGIAYRMLGSVTDAEEVLQEAWLRWQGVEQQVLGC